jgi:hypothetical protein
VTAKQAAVKKYIVRLSDEERERLNTLIHKGKHRAGQLVKARILLKADASEAGDGWSDSEIAAALDTSRHHGCPDSAATGGGRVRVRAYPQAFARFGKAAHLRWSIRGQADRPGLFRPAKGARPVDAEAAGICGRRAEHC